MEAASPRSTRFWRAILLTLCFLCAALIACSLFTDAVESSSGLGFQTELTPNPALVRISSVDAGGPAQTSGLRAGDLVHLRELSPADRYRLLIGVYPHERIPVAVTRGTRTFNVLYRAGGKPVWRWDIWVFAAASFWMLAFAIVIAWRRADLPEARILCVILALNVGASALQAGSWLTPSAFADLVAAAMGFTATVVASVLLVNYALLFGRPVSGVRIALSVLAWASAIAVAVYEVVRLATFWNGGEAWVAQTLGPDWNFEWSAAPYILSLLCAIAGIAATQGKERGRIAWTTASLGLMYLADAGMQLAPAIFPESSRGTALIVAYQLVNVGIFFAPLGMTYALLNRRLLDIGFALNRVAIFSVVSLIIVGTFVLVEWAVGAWLQQTNHTASLLAGAAVALALGLSIHFVHTRVDYVLDRVFFRKRHEDEQAIRRFAHEAAYITDVQTLIGRTIGVLERHADALFVRLALDDGAGCYGSVSENDGAIVSLRTWHRVLDLHGIETCLQGEFAYPMIARGRLVGALVLGPKRSEEAYAPDESRAIEEVAHGVAGALDILAQRAAGLDDGIVAELRAVHAAVAEGFASITAQLERVPR